jgi:uncharacterized glyoxalase superfamily protein PhnB
LIASLGDGVKKMSTHGDRLRSTVVPTVRYRDVPAAIAWLSEAFGFTPHRLLEDAEGVVRYAELTFGTGMIMVGPVDEDNLGKFMVQPGDIGGVETQICYLHVDDAKAHCERASAAGATIVLDITDEVDGGRGYSARDLEGHIWNFGTYDPWARFQRKQAPAPSRGRGTRMFGVLAVLGLLAGTFGYEPTRAALSDAAETVFVRIASASDTPHEEEVSASSDDRASLQSLRVELAKQQSAKAKTEQALVQLREQLALETRLREEAEQSSTQARKQLSVLLSKQETAGRSAAEVRSELDRAQAAKAAAEQVAKDARERLAHAQAAESERQARQLAQRERRARIRADRAAARQKQAAGTAFPPWDCGRVAC